MDWPREWNLVKLQKTKSIFVQFIMQDAAGGAFQGVESGGSTNITQRLLGNHSRCHSVCGHVILHIQHTQAETLRWAMIENQPKIVYNFFLHLCCLSFAEWSGESEPAAIFKLVYGATSGIFGQITSYPMDIVRRRMQTASMMHVGNQYNTILSSLKNIYK